MCDADHEATPQKKVNIKMMTCDLEFINGVRECSGLGRIEIQKDGSYVVVDKDKRSLNDRV